MATYRGDLPTTRARKSLALAVVGLLSGSLIGLNVIDASAHGEAPVDSGAALPPTTAETLVPEGVAAPSPSTVPTTVAKGKNVAPPATVSSTQNPPAPPPPLTTAPGGYAFEMTISPSCAKAGQQMTATAKLKPRAGIAMMAMFADGEAHGVWRAALAPEDGIVTYTWTAPDVPGDGGMTAQAKDPDSDRTGVKTLPFRIVEATGTC